jgi:hypothetical protein
MLNGVPFRSAGGVVGDGESEAVGISQLGCSDASGWSSG